MGIRKKLYIIIVALVGLYAFYYLALPRIIDLNKLNPLITKYIENTYGFKVQIENPSFKFGYTPSIWVKTDSFKIINKDGSSALVVDKPTVEMSILPLIIGHVDLKYFKADNIFADVYFDKNFVIGLGDYLLIKTSNFVVDINDSKILINKFKFNLTDKIKNNKTPIIGNYLFVEKFNKNKYLKASGDISVGEGLSKINFDIDTKLPFNKHLDVYPPEISASITNLNLSDFTNYINTLSKSNISDIGGVLNMEIHSDKEIFEQKQYISNILVDNFYIDTKIFDKKFSYPDKLQVKSLFLLDGDKLNIPSVNVHSSNVDFKLSGNIKKISTSKPIPNLNLKMIDQRAEHLLDLIPYCKKLDEAAKIYISVIKDAHFYSNVNVDLNIKDNLEQPNLYGDIIVDDAYIQRTIKGAQKNALIKLKYNGKNLDLNVHVPTAINQAVDVTGTIDVYGEQYSDLHITSTDKIDLSEAERILMPVHKAFNFLLGPVPIMGFSGYGSIDLKVKGTKKKPHTFGWFKTSNASVSFDEINNLVLTNANSILEFEDFNTKFMLLDGYINGKIARIEGTCNLAGKFNFKSQLQNQDASDFLNILKNSPMLKDFSGAVKNIDKLSGVADLELNINGELLDIENLKIGENVHTSGSIILHSASAKLSEIGGQLNNILGTIHFDDFNMDVNLSTSVGTSKLSLSGVLKKDIASVVFKCDRIRIFDLIKTFQVPSILVLSNPHDNSYIQLNGKYDGSITDIDLKNVKADGQIHLNNFSFIYQPYKLPIKVSNGQINIKNSTLELNKISADIGTASTVIGGKINSLYKNPTVDLSLYSKINQKIADYLYNSKAVYPIKIKGNVSLQSTISGKLENPNVKANLKISESSSLYYLGASLGEENIPINLSLNADIAKNKINVRSFLYNKVISNNKKISNVRQLSANGILYLNDLNNIGFKNFNILTNAPTDTKFFNIVFKKPLIKSGSFTTNLSLNGSMSKPVIKGSLNLNDINIPYIDAVINDISLKFQSSTIIAKIRGNILSNNFDVDANIQNKLYPPYIINEAKFNSVNLNVDNFIQSINNSEIEPSSEISTSESASFDINQLVIKKLLIFADNVTVNQIMAKNVSALISLSNGVFNVNNFKFNLAKGEMEGSAGYNTRLKKYDFDLSVHNADADSLTNSLFDVKGQIYGDIDGQMTLSCKGDDQAECLKSLNGYTAFRVRNGKMPKLGSLEYLLKAGNLLKSGVTGLSINGILDIIVPLKTGHFDFINGSITINNGIADNIQIRTSGKDLNLFITGEYDLSTYIADMYVFGRLSKKISTPFGPIGNASLNTLFNTIPGVNLNNTSDTSLVNSINKIPGLELSNKLYRVFAAEIHGDITGEDYVQSFMWVE